MEVASRVRVSLEGMAKEGLKREEVEVREREGEWKMRMSQRRSCFVPLEAEGWGLVERREVSIASRRSSAFLCALCQFRVGGST